MVNLTPDPPREPFLANHENTPIAPLSDESDDDDPYEGYEMLPLDIEEIDNNQTLNYEYTPNTTVFEANALSDNSSRNIEPIPCIEFDKQAVENLNLVWSHQEETPEKEMDPLLKEEVLKAMDGFTLPSSAFPQWATEIREEDWKNHLLEKIKGEK